MKISYPKWPRYWEGVEESFASIDDLLARIDNLQTELWERLGTASFVNVWKSDREGAEDVMSLGLCGDLWLLIHTLGDDDAVYSVGDQAVTGTTLILDPEGIEWPNRHLLPSDQARALVKGWLEAGLDRDPHTWTGKLLLKPKENRDDDL